MERVRWTDEVARTFLGDAQSGAVDLDDVGPWRKPTKSIDFIDYPP
jgi:hypothetical protein